MFGLLQLHKLINCCGSDYTIITLIISVGLKAREFFKYRYHHYNHYASKQSGFQVKTEQYIPGPPYFSV